MKKLNEMHSAIIDVKVSPKSEAKEGDVVKHSQTVENIIFYVPKYIDKSQSNEYIQIILSRSKILDLAKDIQLIEKETVLKEYFPELPF